MIERFEPATKGVPSWSVVPGQRRSREDKRTCSRCVAAAMLEFAADLWNDKEGDGGRRLAMG